MEPAALSGAVVGAKDVEGRIDTSLELLDMDALNTGRHHALVVQDPEDKRSIKGFCRLAVVYSRAIYPDKYPRFERFIMPAFMGVAVAMNQYTDIDTKVMGRIGVNSAELMKTPWVYFMAFHGFILSEAELEYLGGYMISGGLVFADGHNWPNWLAGYHSLKTTLLDALEVQGLQVAYQMLPNDHPVYHCYFDFDSGPPTAADGIGVGTGVAGVDIIDHLDGLTIDGRLAAILTAKGYYHPWAWGLRGTGPYGGSARQLQFAVNTIIFALTQEGGITHRLMESIY